MTRKQAGEDIIMLSVGDHDFDTPMETVEACKAALDAGFDHNEDELSDDAIEALEAELDSIEARPSAVFSATLPVKPSVTTTSTVPLAMSSPSTKPW